MDRRVFPLVLAINATVVVAARITLTLSVFSTHVLDPLTLFVSCSVLSAFSAGCSLAVSQWFTRAFYRLVLIEPNESDPTRARLLAITRKMANLAGLQSVPRVGVFHGGRAVAFAAGFSGPASIVAFSSKLHSRLNDEELQAVAAHEVAHIASYDLYKVTFLFSVLSVAVLAGARYLTVLLDANLFARGPAQGLGVPGYVVTVLVLEAFFFSLAALPVAALARNQEYTADAMAAKLTSPGAMAAALKKLRDIDDPRASRQARETRSPIQRIRAWWSSHPRTGLRIKRLEKDIDRARRAGLTHLQ